MCFCFNLVDESYFTDSYNLLSCGNKEVCVQPGKTTRRSLLANQHVTYQRYKG